MGGPVTRRFTEQRGLLDNTIRASDAATLSALRGAEAIA